MKKNHFSIDLYNIQRIFRHIGLCSSNRVCANRTGSNLKAAADRRRS